LTREAFSTILPTDWITELEKKFHGNKAHSKKTGKSVMPLPDLRM
jgi:hypothetical protein